MDRKPDVDQIWRKLGIWGRYQVVQLVLIVIDQIPCAFHLLSVVFIGYRPPYRCKDLENQNASFLVDHDLNTSGIHYLSMDYKACSIDVYNNETSNSTLMGSLSCVNGYEYNSMKDISFVTEWDLVCGKQELAGLTQTLIILGQGAGAAFISTFSDRYGRKPVHIICHMFLFAFGLGVAFSPNFYVLAPLRFLTGMVQQGVILTTSILNLERFPKETRGLLESYCLLAWSSGGMILTLLSYSMRDVSWRYIQIILSVWSVYSFIQYWIIDESLRWLIVNGKTEQAKKMIQKACRWNKLDYKKLLEEMNLDDDLLLKVSDNKQNDPISEICVSTENIGNSSTGNEIPIAECINHGNDIILPDNTTDKKRTLQYTLLDIIRHKRLFFNSLILWYVWFTDSLAYFGLYLISSSLAGDRYLNFFLSSLVEIPAALVLLATINRMRRKGTSIFFHAVTGVSLLIGTALMVIGSGNAAAMIAATAFSIIGKFGASGAFSFVFIYTPELYPTNLRNAGIGVASAMSRLGGMMSPFCKTLADYIVWGPGLIFGIMCLVVTVLMTLLPETRGYELPDSIEELKEWHKSKEHREKYKIDDTELQAI